jgi:hypothetical protein
LGWYDLHEELRKDPTLKLRVSLAYELWTREIRVWSCQTRRYDIRRVEMKGSKVVFSWETANKPLSQEK